MFNLFKPILQHLPVRPLNTLVWGQPAIPEGEFIITGPGGIFYSSTKKIIKLFDGYYYGCSKFDKRWYAITRASRNYHGNHLLSFRIHLNGHAYRTRIELKNLPKGCHQIDFIGQFLYITDTYNNRILVFNPISKQIVKEYYPAGKLKNGRLSANYTHCNSIFSINNINYLLFHNETTKTGLMSQWVKTNNEFEIIERIDSLAGDAHNIYVTNDEVIISDSIKGNLLVNNKVVFSSQFLTRGLSISEDIIVVGGSEFGSRERRGLLKGALSVLDRKYKLINQINFPFPIYEVRRVDKKDYSLSNLN